LLTRFAAQQSHGDDDGAHSCKDCLYENGLDVYWALLKSQERMYGPSSTRSTCWNVKLSWEDRVSELAGASSASNPQLGDVAQGILLFVIFCAPIKSFSCRLVFVVRRCCGSGR
jgi:hypothetical protein